MNLNLFPSCCGLPACVPWVVDTPVCIDNLCPLVIGTGRIPFKSEYYKPVRKLTSSIIHNPLCSMRLTLGILMHTIDAS